MSSQRKTVLVTGGSGGIGEGICRKLGEDHNVIVHFNSNSEAAQRICHELKSVGNNAATIQANLTDEQSVTSMFDQAIEQFGKIHAVVANAGNSNFGPISDSSVDDFRKLIDVNAFEQGGRYTPF